MEGNVEWCEYRGEGKRVRTNGDLAKGIVYIVDNIPYLLNTVVNVALRE